MSHTEKLKFLYSTVSTLKPEKKKSLLYLTVKLCSPATGGFAGKVLEQGSLNYDPRAKSGREAISSGRKDIFSIMKG